ncbi:MAG: hypothetical protein IJW65_02830 [Clostridia bacterium]|nr:hypothetical protein [Clostridia bacterium]
MFTKLTESNAEQKALVPKEGDLFKVIEYMGQRFEIRYGYYEEKDRMFEPMAIYPNFLYQPVYTDDGTPFVTAMQQPCRLFRGKKDENSTCEDCLYYQKCEELIGVCSCSKNKKPTDNK